VARRLVAGAIVYAGAWITIYVIMLAEHAVREPSLVAVHVREEGLPALAAVGVSLIVALLARRTTLSPTAFQNLALGFQILGALFIMWGFWGWEDNVAGFLRVLAETGSDVDALARRELPLFHVDGVPWVGIWILLFPLIVPTPPLRAAVGAFACASTVPAVILLSEWVHGRPAILDPWVAQLRWEYFVPVYIVAVIALLAARVVYRTTRELSRAQEMGSYRLIERIGEGGMGEVWKARHRLLARPGAVKLIRPQSLTGAGTVSGAVMERFEREAQATAALKSPHTVELYDFGVAPGGTFYYVMELLDGLDLKSLVDRFGPVAPERAVHFLKQTAHSLMDAHESGLVHRDVKPANIVACRQGPDLDFVKVLDFGLVKEFGSGDRAPAHLTQEGVTSGTPGFMAPEIASGSGDVDGRADLYALGCVGYWLVTGQLVFEGRSAMEILAQHIRETPAPPSTRVEGDLPPEIDTLILDLLAKEPDARPPSARALHARLAAVEAALPSPWTPERARDWWDRHLPRAGSDTVLSGSQP
jgi:serine/threonine-protein kinase